MHGLKFCVKVFGWVNAEASKTALDILISMQRKF